MKRFSSIAVFVVLPFLWLSASFQPPLVPDGAPGETYLAAFPKTITLDGDTSDWAGVPRVTVTTGPHPAANPKEDGSITFAAVADSSNLYTLFEVPDVNIIGGKHGIDFWNEDSVELYINATNDYGLPTYKTGVAQITLPAANIGLPVERAVISGRQYQSLGVRMVAVKTDTGYRIEAAVPLKTDMWDIAPEHGRSIGFQVQLNGASAADRDTKLSWSRFDTADQSYTNPSVFGKLTFFKIGETALPTVSAASVPTAVLVPATNFTVRGTTLYDPDGAQFVVKGVNVNGYNWVWQRETTQDAKLIGDCWKFNLVRVNSFLLSGEQGYQQYSVNNDLDKIVDTFTERKIVVMFEAHDRIGSYYEGRDLDTLVRWFTNLALRYKGNPYVWFDVMNEPGGQFSVDEEKWVNMHQQVIHAIRDVAGADNIIMIEGMHGGQDAGTFDAGKVPEAYSALLQFGPSLMQFGGKAYFNLVFSIHTYDQWMYGDEKMADFFDRALAKNLPMVVGEYGNYGGKDTTPAVQSLFDTAVPRGIGRIVWHWDGSDPNKLTTQGGGWLVDNCTAPTNLTALGQRVWEDNHAGK